MKFSSIVAVALAVATNLGAATSAAQVLPHPPTVDHLPNGLTVVTVPFDTPGIVAYFTLIRTGSRDEVERGHSGFAHLFEHMMFRGSEHYSATEYEHRMQALGADNNAFTTEDYTLYTVTIPAASLPALVPIEADRFEHLSYTEPVFQTETRAVLGEYNKDSASPEEPMWEAMSELAFTRHTYSHTVIGYLADVEAMPHYYRYSRQFFQRFYRPDNATVIVAGDVQHDRVLDLVRQNYGTWRGRRANPVIPAEPDQAEPRSRALAWEGVSPPHMMIGYRVPAFSLANNDSVALDVVQALVFGEASDLYQRLVVQEQKLLSLAPWQRSLHRDPGLFMVDARLAPNVTFDEIQNAVADELARVGRGEYPRDRIEAVVSNLRYELPMELQTATEVGVAVALFTAVTGDPTSLDAYAQHLTMSAITPDEIARVARTYLTPARRTVVTLTEADHAPAGAVRVGPNHPAHGHGSAPSGAPQ